MPYKSEEHLFYRVFGRNRPIETIDDYDQTVHRGPFQLYCSRRIFDGALGWAVWDAL